ncbi:hypothetical protein HYW17_05840 [Candidatus Uhrbacteria bacterium]|nr:hypothetical protein [Candidatus Uhrbacteria bacterium]
MNRQSRKYVFLVPLVIGTFWFSYTTGLLKRVALETLVFAQGVQENAPQGSLPKPNKPCHCVEHRPGPTDAPCCVRCEEVKYVCREYCPAPRRGECCGGWQEERKPCTCPPLTNMCRSTQETVGECVDPADEDHSGPSDPSGNCRTQYCGFQRTCHICCPDNETPCGWCVRVSVPCPPGAFPPGGCYDSRAECKCNKPGVPCRT